MRRLRRFPVVLLAVAVAGVPALAGCIYGPEEVDAGPDEAGIEGDLTENVFISTNATPENPALAAIGVTEDTSSVKIDVSLTNLVGDSGEPVSPREEDEGGEPDLVGGEDEGDPGPVYDHEDAAFAPRATVTVLAGEVVVYEETFELSREELGGRDAVVVSEDFGRDVVALALGDGEPEPVVTLRVTVDRGNVSVIGWLIANPAL